MNWTRHIPHQHCHIVPKGGCISCVSVGALPTATFHIYLPCPRVARIPRGAHRRARAGESESPSLNPAQIWAFRREQIQKGESKNVGGNPKG